MRRACAGLTIAFACGVLQNLSHEPEWSKLLIQQNVHPTLEAYLVHPDPLVVRYAAGALHNANRLHPLHIRARQKRFQVVPRQGFLVDQVN